MPPTIETVWQFTDPAGRAGVSHLRVWGGRTAPAVVVVGELADNPGGSIEASAARIAGALRRDVLLDGAPFRLLLHHPATADEPDGRFHEVDVAQHVPDGRPEATRGAPPAAFRPLSRAAVERLVGEPVPVWGEVSYTSGAVVPRP